MTPGTLFFDRHFQFHDGEEGPKILVALGTGHGVTIVVKTTSQGRRYRNEYGCQADHRFSQFPPGARLLLFNQADVGLPGRVLRIQGQRTAAKALLR